MAMHVIKQCNDRSPFAGARFGKMGKTSSWKIIVKTTSYALVLFVKGGKHMDYCKAQVAVWVGIGYYL
jgi:hypothetical protein